MRSSSTEMEMPLFKKAISRIRLTMVSSENSVVSKISGSGVKVMVVPVSSASPMISSGVTTSPREKVMRYTWPFRRTSAVRLVDRALTTDTPTP